VTDASGRRPSLRVQIEAVQWCELHLVDTAKRARMRASESDLLLQHLQAAIATLQALEQGRVR
jgi:hypothetical protein